MVGLYEVLLFGKGSLDLCSCLVCVKWDAKNRCSINDTLVYFLNADIGIMLSFLIYEQKRLKKCNINTLKPTLI